MKKLKLLLLFPLLLLTGCQESLTIGVHYRSGENVVHYACSGVRVVKGDVLRMRLKDNEIQFISGDFVTYDLPGECPVCGWEAE